MSAGLWVLAGLAVVLGLVVLYDVTQKRHAVIHNFPIVGHFRYLFEAVGPELRQYIVTGNDEERPFSRDQRRSVYASSKKENNYFGFGTDNDLELSPNGCDMINVAREAMLAIGCIQAQRCHTGRCPTGVATQDKWLMSGLDPAVKSARLANYITSLRMELLHLAHAGGEVHPSLVALDRIEILDDNFGSRSARDVFQYREGWGLPAPEERAAVAAIMAHDTLAAPV